ADAITYALGISAPGVNSGLVDTLSNDPVLLFVESGVVVGRVGGPAGAIVFTISVDAAGVVTLNQSRAVVHDDPTDPDEASSPAMLLSANLVTLTATITDGDGDTANATKNIGTAFKFEDDGPSINVNATALPSLIVDETNFAIDASASFAALFTSSFGNDGPKDTDDNDIPDTNAITYALGVSAPGVNSGLVDTLSNDPVLLF